MKISQAAKIWIEYHVTNSKKNTVRAYRWIIDKFCTDFGGEKLTELSSEKVLHFLTLSPPAVNPKPNEFDLPIFHLFSIS